MRREVVWSLRARRDLASIRAYIGQVAPLAAERFTLRLIDAAESLAELAERGRPARGNVRELVAVAPYVIRYTVKAGQVSIIRIRHGALRPDR